MVSNQGAAGTTPPDDAGKPQLDVYWSKEFGDVLDSWGEGNAWDEIRFLQDTISSTFLHGAHAGQPIERFLVHQWSRFMF